jgi:hypothetical protein
MENQHYIFRKIAKCFPFGWIRHGSGTEIAANSTFWRGDRLPDGLMEGEMKEGLFW